MIQGRIDSTVVVCGDSVYAIGGENSRGNALNSIERISIKSLLTDYTNANNNRATTAWQTFRCCLSMPRAFANAVSVQDRYIVVAGGRSNAVVGQNRYDRERRVLDSVEIIDTHFPYLSMPFGGPLLNYPRYSFGMGVVQNRIFVVGGQCQYESGRYVYRGHSVEYLDFLPPCLDTTSDPAESEALSSTMMSWQVHGDRRLRDIVCQEVVRVGSCLVFERGVVLDTRRDQIWNFRSPFSGSSQMVALFDGIVSVELPGHVPGHTNNRPILWKRLGLVDKHTLLFTRMLELSDMQIQSLVPRQF